MAQLSTLGHMRIFQFIPKDEVRFWRIFRCLIVPVGLFSSFICLVGAIATLAGENIATVNDKPLGRVAGTLLCLAFIPLFTFVFTTGITCFEYVERRIKRLFRK